jgi:hypothetical protein
VEQPHRTSHPSCSFPRFQPLLQLHQMSAPAFLECDLTSLCILAPVNHTPGHCFLFTTSHILLFLLDSAQFCPHFITLLRLPR